jgi:hypothetical protein
MQLLAQTPPFFFCFPIESTSSPLIWMGLWQILSIPTINGFFQIKYRDFVVGPQVGHPTRPLVTHPGNSL